MVGHNKRAATSVLYGTTSNERNTFVNKWEGWRGGIPADVLRGHVNKHTRIRIRTSRDCPDTSDTPDMSFACYMLIRTSGQHLRLTAPGDGFQPWMMSHWPEGKAVWKSWTCMWTWIWIWSNLGLHSGMINCCSLRSDIFFGVLSTQWKQKLPKCVGLETVQKEEIGAEYYILHWKKKHSLNLRKLILNLRNLCALFGLLEKT